MSNDKKPADLPSSEEVAKLIDRFAGNASFDGDHPPLAFEFPSHDKCDFGLGLEMAPFGIPLVQILGHELTEEDRRKNGVTLDLIFTSQDGLHSAVYQESPDSKRVFRCGNHALVAQGQYLAGIWDKKGLEFVLVPEFMRIAEPETYADIRKD